YYWKLHHVPLNANKTFQVVFEARKGAGNSSGGFSLDDINISETEDFEKVLNNSEPYTVMYGPLYYSSEGYRFQAALLVQITFQMLDQNPHIQKRMSSEQSITTDPDWASS
ncbi:hypothetical protein M9458_032429, partial [Cirrhinus mrigala]